MQSRSMRKTGVIFAIFLGIFLYVAPKMIYSIQNSVVPDPNAPAITEEAISLHASLEIADLHADTLLWYKDLLQETEAGHVDIPRLIKGNVALQGFGIVTKVPMFINMEKNTNKTDLIFLLAAVQQWGIKAMSSVKERALIQARKLHAAARNSGGNFRVILYKEDLAEYIEYRHQLQQSSNGKLVNLTAGFLGIEGAQCVENDVHNVNDLFEAGVRIMSISHFFDNQLGGSAHGEEQYGLTTFGRSVVERMQKLEMLVDISHCSKKVVDDILSIATSPVVATHSGVASVCNNTRNLPDDTLIRIAKTGGIVGIGFFEPAICAPTIAEIVKSIKHAVKVMGIEHVCLGSDYDGSIVAPFASDKLIELTQALMNEGYTSQEISLLMGRNLINLLLNHLPGRPWFEHIETQPTQVGVDVMEALKREQTRSKGG